MATQPDCRYLRLIISVWLLIDHICACPFIQVMSSFLLALDAILLSCEAVKADYCIFTCIHIIFSEIVLLFSPVCINEINVTFSDQGS